MANAQTQGSPRRSLKPGRGRTTEPRNRLGKDRSATCHTIPFQAHLQSSEKLLRSHGGIVSEEVVLLNFQKGILWLWGGGRTLARELE